MVASPGGCLSFDASDEPWRLHWWRAGRLVLPRRCAVHARPWPVSSARPLVSSMASLRADCSC